MRRAATTALAAAAVLAAAGGATAPAAVAPPSVKVVGCSVAEHEAAFRGRMSAIAGSERMWMRFTLLERTGSAGFAPVKAPGLGVWRRSKRGVKLFGYRQAVKGLPENAVHRMRVDFRWIDGDGQVIQQFQKLSALCKQFVALPNLVVRIVGSDPARVEGVTRYHVRVHNIGRAPVASAGVGLSVDGRAVDEQTVAGLGPRKRRVVSFRGPDCGTSARAQVDAAETVVESTETDNVHELPCAEIAKR